MPENFQEVLAAYDYSFPSELIAKEPAHPRDSARLLIFDHKTDSVTFDVFSNIEKYLPKNAVLVMNQTKVIPAKMTLKKSTGGAISALYLTTENDTIRVLASGSLRPGDKLQWKEHTLTVVERNEQEALLKPSFNTELMITLLEQFGETPLPPYMKDSPMPEAKRREEYQTVFALHQGSVAAPTAGLHFTRSLINKIVQSKRSIHYISLHVGLGTFSPLQEYQLKNRKLHLESYSIDQSTADSLNEMKAEGRPMIAVGTTTVRTLESASDGPKLTRLSGSTDLFITESYKPHFVDALITNFHVPKSSLLMLVSAFTGREKLLEIYKHAIEERMRLFSFGDAMLIL